MSDVLSKYEMTALRGHLDLAQWSSGLLTAGTQSAQVKNNRQIAEGDPQLILMRKIVLGALSRNAQFFAATLPSQIFPPMFNCYGGAMNSFGRHVDNAMRLIPNSHHYLRTDVSATLFLSEPDQYEGGELVIEDTYGEHAIKLAAGSMVIYPATSVHEVRPVTQGQRVACFMWMQSMVRDVGERRALYEMDMALLQLRESCGDTAPIVRLTGLYHNLLRRWAS